MLPLLLAAGAGIASSAIGAAAASGDRKQASDLINKSIRDYESMGIPSVEAQQLVLEELRSVGQLTPELEQMVNLGPSAVGEISTDAGYKDAQLKALDELTSIGEGGGLRLSDKAQIEQALSQVRQQEKGSRDAILANARDRGVAGGGSELAAQLSNQQNSAQNAYAQGLDVAALAQDRAFNAIIEGGQLGGRLRDQEYGEKLNAARAADEIARFNAQNRIDMGQRNVNRRNEAQGYNLGEAQRISDANVGTRNQGQQYNTGLIQQQFDNQLALNQGKANARSGQASNLQSGANATQQMWGGVGQGIGQIGTQLAYADMLKKKGV